ncbi:NTP/NDP exchange transporter [Helicobacter anatolicus]|uniref:NTP/NDP exchange transporter n=1 Tax=Helicobacter anatolicus TaxID=2905874 RepID=UPI002FCDF7A2|nr:MFS transporter [Helicobacter anatolicus]
MIITFYQDKFSVKKFAITPKSEEKMQLFYKVFKLKPKEWKLLLYSVSFILLLFASYSILRPIRDALGLEGGKEELKWLFMGTFLATLLSSIVAMFVSSRVQRRYYINSIFYFFALNLVGFYIAFYFISPSSSYYLWLSRCFFIWVSVFNIFVISSAWSLLTDLFNKDSSKRLFGIVMAGSSLGSILGSFGVAQLIVILGHVHFIAISIVLILLSVVLKSLLVKESYLLLAEDKKQEFKQRFFQPVGVKNPFSGFKIIIQSPYLLTFLAFILLLTSVSTFLYMEQARIIKIVFTTRDERVRVFANIDFFVQSASLFLQIFATSRIMEKFGAKFLLSTLGFLVGIGFIILAFSHPSFLPLVIIMSIRRIGEYVLIKPGREMLFVPMNSEQKYKVKNFLDSVVYRGGDTLGAQLEGALAKISITLTLLVGALLSFAWGTLGYYLGKKYEE